ncbi:MAG: NAD(P)H-binding protein [Acidobacteriota bacterium]|nr:NAD(P)H-binding protein [Acidobacteriota bacterium]
MKRIAIAGATGAIGRALISELSAEPVVIRALSRTPDRAGFTAPVETVRADLTAPESLDQALEGIGSLFLIWTAPPAPIAAAVTRMVRTPHLLFQQPNPARRIPEQIEALTKPRRHGGRFCVRECSRPIRCSGGHGSSRRRRRRAGPSWRFRRHPSDYVLTGPESLTQYERFRASPTMK